MKPKAPHTKILENLFIFKLQVVAFESKSSRRQKSDTLHLKVKEWASRFHLFYLHKLNYMDQADMPTDKR